MAHDASIRTRDDPRVARVVAFFEGLTRDDLPRLPEIYAARARFKDPFNDVTGIDEVTRVFAHMYEKLDAPRFVVHEALAEGDQCFLTWDFLFRFKGGAREQLVRGATHIRFDAAGLVSEHRDYWDAAEEFYEKLPVLGVLMRWLKRRAAS